MATDKKYILCKYNYSRIAKVWEFNGNICPCCGEDVTDRKSKAVKFHQVSTDPVLLKGRF